MVYCLLISNPYSNPYSPSAIAPAIWSSADWPTWLLLTAPEKSQPVKTGVLSAGQISHSRLVRSENEMTRESLQSVDLTPEQQALLCHDDWLKEYPDDFENLAEIL